jgi:hypothetical protein
LEAIHQRFLLLLWWQALLARLYRLLKRGCAFIIIPLNLRSLVGTGHRSVMTIPSKGRSDVRAAHHASTSKHSIVDRVCGNVSILTLEDDLDHNEVMDMLQIISNCFLCMSRTTVENDQVSCRSNSYLVGNMTRKDELAIIPTDLDLVFS